MSDSQLLERMQAQMERLSDKVDEVLSVLGDIRANEKLTEHRFIETDRRHEELKEELHELREQVKADYTTKDEFSLVKKIVYTACGVILFAFLSASVAFVVQSPPSTVITKVEGK